MDIKLELMLDHAEISNVVNRFASSLDLQDWSQFRSCFMDEIEADYSDLRNEPAIRIKADDFVESRRAALSSLKTQHQLTNLNLTIETDEATCVSCVVINRFHPHYTGVNRFNTHGYYIHTLARTLKGWKISKIKQIVFWNEGNPHLHSAVRQMAAKGQG
ncbi:MAG: nuclear transport factor 2 family protein [Leptolyngbyaceae cyanobacterium SM1_4_3]|nr:nuclear transport factor 2 family protein [Leptolyngbyaceae cyanobacterium SM1_4_3]